jgi:hypothetical protein
MDGSSDESADDLRRLGRSAVARGDFAWRQLRRYGSLDTGLMWLAGVAAGGAGVAAVLEAPPSVTAVVAFASALSTAVGKPVRSKREHAVLSAANYHDIAWKADQAAKNAPDRETRLKSLEELQQRWYELEKTAAP